MEKTEEGMVLHSARDLNCDECGEQVERPEASKVEEIWIQYELPTEMLWGHRSATEYAEAHVAYHSPLYEARSAFPTRD